MCCLLGKEYRWKTGKVVIFDDTYEHFAINLTDNIRVVLFMDYLRPLPLPLHWLNKFCINDSCRTKRSSGGVGTDTAKMAFLQSNIPHFKCWVRRIHTQPHKYHGEFLHAMAVADNDALSVSCFQMIFTGAETYDNDEPNMRCGQGCPSLLWLEL